MIWLARIALALAAVGIMWVEGSYQPGPGVGFAIALALLLAAAMIGHKENDHA